MELKKENWVIKRKGGQMQEMVQKLEITPAFARILCGRGYDTVDKAAAFLYPDGAELTDAKLGEVRNPRFSPDDRQIVFQCLKKDKKDNDLYVINCDGTGLTQLTFNKSYDAEPYWANDGHIYFSSDRGGRKGNFQIWRFTYGSYNPSQRSSHNAYAAPTAAPVPASQPIYHTVSEKETITSIAQKYNVTVRDIVKWNKLRTMTLISGTRLKVSE